MTLIYRLLITAAAMTFASTAVAEEIATDDAGWYIITTDKSTIHFPTQPKIDTKGGTTIYSALDSTTFPVVMYSFSESAPKAPVDVEQLVNDNLEKLSTYPLKLLHHEVSESTNEIVIDSLCTDAKTRIMRCERMIIAKEKIYTMTTLFFPGSAENHEYFVQHFASN